MKSLIGLSHVTTRKNCESIKENGFRKSVSGVRSIQWLGDGIYFWYSADKKAKQIGKKLVRKKFRFPPKTKVITLSLELEENEYLDLDSWDDSKLFINFLTESGNNGLSLLQLMKDTKRQKDFSSSTKNKIGTLFGEQIDRFIYKLKEKFDISICMVSFSFCTGEDENYFYEVSEKNVKQFCLKNEKIVNNKKEEWIIDNI